MKPMNDYSFVRGFCYPMGWARPLNQVKKELGYAARLNLNSSRIWLMYTHYEKDPEGFIDRLIQYVRTAYSMGITTMPILWNGNGIDPAILEPEFRKVGDKYVEAVINALKDEPGIIMWDIMNEPSCNDYIRKAKEEELPERNEKMWNFVRYYCRLVKSLDPINAVTIGHTFIEDVEPTIEDVDVFSFHDYFSTRKEIKGTYDAAVEISKKYNKTFLNSELACLCRANPYDLSLEICEEYNTGWYLFELMIGGYWGDVHGIFYPDGTIRDPAIVAAIMGFHRNRSETAIKANPNKEGYAERGIRMVKEALEEKTEVFRSSRKPVEEVLEAAEFCANLLECCEMVPMYDPPTAKINRLRNLQNPDMLEARKLAYEMVELLKEYCQLI